MWLLQGTQALLQAILLYLLPNASLKTKPPSRCVVERHICYSTSFLQSFVIYKDTLQLAWCTVQVAHSCGRKGELLTKKIHASNVTGHPRFCFPRLLLDLLPEAADGAANGDRGSGVQHICASCLHLQSRTQIFRACPLIHCVIFG